MSCDIIESRWSPRIIIADVVHAFYELLQNPNPDDPLVPEIAQMFTKNRERYNVLAREWTLRYAKQ